MLHIYIIHEQSLSTRNVVLDKLFNLIKRTQGITDDCIETHVVTDYSVDYVKINMNALLPKLAKPDEILPTDSSFYKNIGRGLNLQQISSALKHVKALSMAASSNDDDVHLVLEDDVEFNDTAIRAIQKLKNEVLSDSAKFDLLLLGQPTKTQISSEENTINLINTECDTQPIINCESYLFNTKCAKTLLNSFTPLYFTTNVQMSFAIASKHIRTASVIPNIFADGSKLGTHVCTLTGNNILLFNEAFKNAFIALGKNSEQYTNKDTNLALLQALKQDRFAKHPDIIYMMAMLTLREGKLKESEILFKEAFESYSKQGGVLDRSSGFMRSYFDLFRMKQSMNRKQKNIKIEKKKVSFQV